MEEKDWSISDIKVLQDHLKRALKNRDLSDLGRKLEKVSDPEYDQLSTLSYKTLHRWVGMKPEKLLQLPRDEPYLLFQYLKFQNAFAAGIIDGSQKRQFVKSTGNFLRTTKSEFGIAHLRKLTGDFIMYRRYWRKPDNVTYMSSRVSIRYSKYRDAFTFRESQYWPEDRLYGEEEWREVNRGYLFPSGKAILSLCQSTRGNTAKFLSISELGAHSVNDGRKITSFSGTGIASSDTPPHIGYGFHCMKEVDADKLRWRRPASLRRGDHRVAKVFNRYQSEKLSESELNSINLDILRKIFHNDGYKGHEPPQEGDS